MPRNDAELKECADQRYDYWLDLAGEGSSKAEQERQYAIAVGVCRLSGFLF